MLPFNFSRAGQGGFTGLSAAVQTVLEEDPTADMCLSCGGRRGDLGEVVVVGWRRALPIREATGTWTFRLAEADSGPVSRTRAQLSGGSGFSS